MLKYPWARHNFSVTVFLRVQLQRDFLHEAFHHVQPKPSCRIMWDGSQAHDCIRLMKQMHANCTQEHTAIDSPSLNDGCFKQRAGGLESPLCMLLVMSEYVKHPPSLPACLQKPKERGIDEQAQWPLNWYLFDASPTDMQSGCSQQCLSLTDDSDETTQTHTHTHSHTHIRAHTHTRTRTRTPTHTHTHTHTHVRTRAHTHTHTQINLQGQIHLTKLQIIIYFHTQCTVKHHIVKPSVHAVKSSQVWQRRECVFVCSYECVVCMLGVSVCRHLPITWGRGVARWRWWGGQCKQTPTTLPPDAGPLYRPPPAAETPPGRCWVWFYIWQK